MLAAAGYRVIVPYLRGYGTTRFLVRRDVAQWSAAAIAVDIDRVHGRAQDRQGDHRRLRLGRADGRHHRGAVAGALQGAGLGERLSRSAARPPDKQPLPPQAELQWWYQYYFATDRGRAGYEQYRRDFAKLIWQLASPKWNFDDATFERSAAAFDNPDHVSIVIHNYRWRLGLAEGEAQIRRTGKEARRSAGHHRADHHDRKATPMARHTPEPAAYAKKFTGKYAHRMINGIGHNVPQEAPRRLRARRDRCRSLDRLVRPREA